ncbi:hypothetical protein AK88_00936 [Plasmodium fragile]|uniref:Rh5 coiled-coil domain-containing protein n=1 Tax=Plasmodium fragile TaxID=5857 RepID=A0A0D9QRB2_PLAFR|nr:uncharacterized protein AK88_00936 [Plasmodium fragile]KJP89493.1 hypothetical protein AK88_00936 [Plasmodium fragile]
MEPDQLEHHTEPKGHEQNNNINENRYNHLRDDSRIGNENVNSTQLRNNSSFISLKNYKLGRRPSRYSYLHKDKTHTDKKDNTDTIHNTGNTKNNDKKYTQKKVNTIPNTSIKKTQRDVHVEVTQGINLDYVCVLNDDSRIILLLFPYNPEIYAFREMKFYSEHHYELAQAIKWVFNVEIKRIEGIISKSMHTCLDQTRELNTLIYHLENPEKHGIQESDYDGKKKEYKTKLDKLQQCMKINYNNNKTDIQKTKGKTYDTIWDISCPLFNYCKTYIYHNVVVVRKRNVTEYNIAHNTSFINNVMQIHKSAHDILGKVKEQLKKPLVFQTTEFILEEIKHIADTMNLHLEAVNKSAETIDTLSKQPWSTYFHRYVLQDKFFFLAYNYSTFKISTESLKKLENVSNSKLEKLYHTFTILEDGLNYNINTYMSTTYSMSMIHSILSDSEEIVQSVEKLRNSSYDQIKEHIPYSNVQIKKTKEILDQKILTLEQYPKDSRELIKKVNETYTLKLKASVEIEKYREKTEGKMSSLEKSKILLEVLNKIQSKTNEITKINQDVEQYSKQMSSIKSKFQQSEKIINEDVHKIKELIENEKQHRFMKEEIKKHLEYFPVALDNIKKIISERDKIKNYILSIDNLMKDGPYDSNEFITKKTELQNKAKSIMDSFYNENSLQTFVDNLAQFYTKNQTVNKEENTKEEEATKILYEKTKEQYDRLVNMNCDGIPKMLNDLSEVLNSLSRLKNDIITAYIQYMIENVSSSFNKLNEENNRIKNTLNNYEECADKLKTYTNKINNIKDKFRTILIKKVDEDVPEEKTIYEEYTTYKDHVANKGSTIAHHIDAFKENITKANEQMEAYKKVIQITEIQNSEIYQKTKILLDVFKTKNENSELEKLQKQLRHHKESVSNTINQIENTKKVIDTLKLLHTLMKNSNENTQSILKIKENKNHLINKIDNHIQELNSYHIIEENDRSSLLNMLKEEKNNVEKEIPDAPISTLEAHENELKGYYEKEKNNMEKQIVTNADDLEKYQTQCKNTQQEIHKFNVIYQVLENKIEKLIKDQHSQIITLGNKLISTTNTDINEKIERNLNFLKGIKIKMNAFNFDEDVKKDIDHMVQSRISAFKDKCEKDILQHINNNIEKINSVKQNHDAYMKAFHKEKDHNIEFKDEKSNMENIYGEMKKKTLDILNKIENEQSTILNQVEQIEKEHAIILIHHAVYMIDKENTKAKSVMEDIESSKTRIDEIKGNTEEFKQNHMNNFEYEEYYQKAIQSNKEINVFSTNATNDKNNADKIEDINKIKVIKNKINDYLSKVKVQYNCMEEIRKQMNSMKDLLASDSSNTIAKNILNNTQDALKFNQEAKNELNKSNKLLEEVAAQITEAEQHKSKIDITLEDEQIIDQINKIELINHEILNKKKREMESYLRKIKEYKDKCTTQVSNSNRGKDKIEFLKTAKNNINSSLNNVHMSNINENIKKSEQYLKDIEVFETKATNNVNLFMQHEQTIKHTLQQSQILGIETKSKKKINKATEIMEEIKTEYSKIQKKVNDLQETLNILKEPQNIEDTEDELENQTSTNAKVIIQSNLERVKHMLSQLTHIKQEEDNIFKRATDTMNSLKKTSYNKDAKTLDTVKKDEPKYIEYLSQITAYENQIVTEMNKLNGISSNVVSIQKELNESRKNYEIGLLQKIDEIGKSRKPNMDLKKKESINSTMNSFSSLFNGLDLNQYDFKKNTHDYQQKMKKIHNKFDEALNKIDENLKKASEESANYTLANQLRREAQQEKAKLKNSEEEAIKYIQEIEKMECMRFINHMKRNLDKISTSINKEKLKINEGHEYIQQLLQVIKKADDISDISEKVQQAEEKYAELQTTIHSTHKNMAKDMFKPIVTCAKFINIKIIPELPLTGTYVNAAVQLKFQPDAKVTLRTGNNSQTATELDLQKNIQNAYHVALEIHKCANEIDAQQMQNKQLMVTVNELHHKMKFIDELKNKVQIAKSNENAVSGKIIGISNKIAELDYLSCSERSYDKLLDETEQTKLKNIRDSFNQQKNVDENMDFNLKDIEKDFFTSQTSLTTVEQAVEALEANETTTDNLEKKNDQIEAVHNNIGNIEKNIARLNTYLDKLIHRGRKCEIARYTSLSNNVKSKINADEEIIDNMQEQISQYLTFVQDNYNATVEDVLTLNEYFNKKLVPDHLATNFEQSNNKSEELSTVVEQLRAIINNIKNALIEVNDEEPIFTSLENSAQEIEKLYNTLYDKKNTLNEIYKTSVLVKSQEMKSTVDKYINIAEIFNNVLDNQKLRIINNNSSIIQVKNMINIQLKKLEDTDSTFTLESINTFHKLSDEIQTSIDKFKKLDQTNRQEHKNVGMHKERIAHFINRRDSLKNAVKEHEQNTNLKKLREDIRNHVINNIKNTNGKLINSDDLYIKLMKKVDENYELCNNKYTQNYVSQVLQKIEDLKKRFNENLPEKEKVLQIKSNFSDIKSIFDQIKTLYNVKVFITDMYRKIDAEKESVKDQTNMEKLELTIQNVTDMNDEVKTYLSNFTNALERINIMKKEIDDLFSSLPSNNTNPNENAKEYVNGSVEIINELNRNISKIIELQHYAEGVITKLEEVSKLTRPPVNDSKDETQMLSYETDSTKHDNSQSDDHSETKNTNGQIRLAGAIIIGLSLISGVVLLNGKHNPNEEDEHHEHDHHEAFEDNNDYNMYHKDEVIEVCFNDSD